MKIDKFESYEDLCEHMITLAQNGFHSVAVLLFDDAILLLKEFMRYEDLKTGLLNIASPSYDKYTKEYYVSLSEDMVVSVEPAYASGKYLNAEADITFLHGDVHSSITEQADLKNCHELKIGNDGIDDIDNIDDINDKNDIDDTGITEAKNKELKETTNEISELWQAIKEINQMFDDLPRFSEIDIRLP